LAMVAGARVIRAGMVAKLAAVKHERNIAILKESRSSEGGCHQLLVGVAPEY
jgi:hypothetical protein